MTIRRFAVVLVLTALSAGLDAQQIKQKVPASLALKPDFSLEVRRTAEATTGDIYQPEEWVTQLSVPTRELMRFRSARTGQARGSSSLAAWRIYKGAPPLMVSGAPAPNLVKEGPAGTVPFGQLHQFDIDLRVVLPAKPDNQTYYVQVVGLDATGKYTPARSPLVALKYEPLPGGTRFTTKDLHGELWQPMPVGLYLTSFSVLNADEDDDCCFGKADGDEPYFMAFAIFADGTTIKPDLNLATRTIDFTTSSVRLQSPGKTHGNIPRAYGHLKGGQSSAITQDVGRFETSILPVGLDLLDEVENTPNIPKLLTVNTPLPTHQQLMANTVVALAVMVIEEDETPTDLANQLRAAAADLLQRELNTRVQSLSLKHSANVAALLEAFTSEALIGLTQGIEQKLTAVAKDFYLKDAWIPAGINLVLHQLADPDDRIDVQVRLFNYAQLRNAGPGGVPINMEFKADGVHYQMLGRARRR